MIPVRVTPLEVHANGLSRAIPIRDSRVENVVHTVLNCPVGRMLSRCVGGPPMSQSLEHHRIVVDTGLFWQMGAAADSRIRVGIAVVLTVVAFALLDFLSDVLGHYISHRVAAAAVRAASVGLAAGALMWAGLIAVRQRRQYINAEIDRIAELNHRIRNSLEVIADAQHFAQDPVRSMVLESVAKIDKTLQEVLPSVRNR